MVKKHDANKEAVPKSSRKNKREKEDDIDEEKKDNL